MYINTQKLVELLVAIDQRGAAKVEAVEIQKIECVTEKTVWAAEMLPRLTG